MAQGKNDLRNLIQSFIDSQQPKAELIGWENQYVNLFSCKGSVVNCIRRMRVNHVLVEHDGDHIYLINTINY